MPRELTKQGKRDHTLPTSRATRDDHGRLVILPLRLRDFVHHQFDRKLLLFLQDELLAALNLVRGEREELSTRSNGRAQQLIRIRRPGHFWVKSAA